MDETDAGFPKAERLRKRREFLKVYRHGRRFLGSDHVFYLLENRLSWSRLGITASRKTGSAVVRNRIKRRLREAFRANKRAAHPPCDLVVNARRSASLSSPESVQEELLRALRRWHESHPKGGGSK